MNIIAKTDHGFIISASKKEVEEVLNAVSGEDSSRNVEIGQKIPALDYASTLRKMKELPEDYDLVKIGQLLDSFQKKYAFLRAEIESIK